MAESNPTVRRIAVHPIKALDPMTVASSELISTGSLAHDREFAIVDDDGEYVHGKRTPQAHRIRARYNFGPDQRIATFREEGATTARTFDLVANRDGAEAWLSETFGLSTQLLRRTDGGYPDLMEYPSGPTVISTGTIRAVASWFPDMTPAEARLRFRANIEIDGVPPFWEDRLYTAGESEVEFEIGAVRFAGVQPTPRCVVPLRNPWNGTETEGFRETFIRNRSETYPEWGSPDAFDHFFHLMVNTHVPTSEESKRISVGDAVTVRE